MNIYKLEGEYKVSDKVAKVNNYRPMYFNSYSMENWTYPSIRDDYNGTQDSDDYNGTQDSDNYNGTQDSDDYHGTLDMGDYNGTQLPDDYNGPTVYDVHSGTAININVMKT